MAIVTEHFDVSGRDFIRTTSAAWPAGSWTPWGSARRTSCPRTIPSGGGGRDFTALVERTISGMVSDTTVTSLGANAFRKCTAVTGVCFPSISGEAKAESLKEMTNLSVADLGNCTKLGDMMFQSDTALTTLILRRTSGICAAENSRVFLSAGNGKTVYVPSALISTYQGATNWSGFYSGGQVSFSAIEGSYYETHYADGTTIPTT